LLSSGVGRNILLVLLDALNAANAPGGNPAPVKILGLPAEEYKKNDKPLVILAASVAKTPTGGIKLTADTGRTLTAGTNIW